MLDALPPIRSMGAAEEAAVVEVMRSDCLSGFYGSWGDEFWGGPKVRALEAAWCAAFDVAHAISMNSATSGLYAAMGAAGIQPGDEVIVPPYTMSATAMAPLVYGAVPIFCDIDPATYCLDPARVREALTERTRAIIAVNLFGQPAPLRELRELADERGLVLIEDNAQAPFAREDGSYTGTIGHIGVFSLNYHKHIHAGEGGVCVTSDERLATRLSLVRNHAESVAGSPGAPADTDLIGFNYRMTELSAAVAAVQLQRAKELLAPRVAAAEELTAAAEGLAGITPPAVRPGAEHVYYLWTARLDEAGLGVPPQRFSAALTAEGFPNFVGYVPPLYRLPIFQSRGRGSPAAAALAASWQDYAPGLCPETERAHEQLLCFEVCMYDLSEDRAAKLGEALRKVHRERAALAS